MVVPDCDGWREQVSPFADTDDNAVARTGLLYS